MHIVVGDPEGTCYIQSHTPIFLKSSCTNIVVGDPEQNPTHTHTHTTNSHDLTISIDRSADTTTKRSVYKEGILPP